MSEKSNPVGPEARRDAARWSAVFDAAVHAVVIIDRRGRIQTVNPAAERMFGYERNELRGRNVKLLMPEPDAGGHDGYIERYLESGEPRIIGVGREVTALRKDGETIPIHLSVGEFELEEEQGFVAVIHDVSAKQAAQDRLRESEQVLRMTFEEAPLASAILNLEGRILSVNRRFAETLGPGGEAESTLADVLHPDDRPIGPSLGNDLNGRRCRVIDRKGREHEVVLHLNVVEDADQRPRLVVAQFEDHTERLRVEAEVREHQERLARVDRVSMVGEMATGIAHEVNQPLSAIANYSRAAIHMIREGSGEKAEITETLEKMHKQAQRAGEVIRRIRQFVAKHATEPRRLSVNEAVREAIELAEIDTKSRRVRLETRFTEDLPPIVFDPIQIQQVILNLLRNAIESTTDGRNTVTIHTRKGEGETIVISVSDQGPGIPDEIESRLFNRFFTTKNNSMGMGLAISRSIVEASGGRLWFTRNPEHGVTFHVQLATTRG